MKKETNALKKITIILVVIAIILAIFSLSYNTLYKEDRVPTENPAGSTVGGEVGIEIISPNIEDKGADLYGGG